jgi:signal peptidase I
MFYKKMNNEKHENNEEKSETADASDSAEVTETEESQAAEASESDTEETEAPESEDKPKKEEKPQDIYEALFDWAEMFVTAITLVVLVMTFLFRHSPVVGSSMYPTLHERDLLIVSNLPYEPKQGGIVVFQNAGLYEEPFVKRVIAVSGQTVDIDFDKWQVYVDGKPLDEDYVNYDEMSAMRGSVFSFPLTLEEGYIWCMGDNRNNSTDSRDGRVGPVDKRFILGHCIWRIFPFDRFGGLE